MSDRKIKRALISVYDKTGLVEFARALVGEFGVEIISTGGTARHLKENGIPVTLVEDITGFPEMLDGRVKTLHPKIHAAILADRDNPEHMRQLKEQGIEPIDMVVVNLYPFEKTVADPNCTFEQAIEMIDIGGPCLLRAAAKNHRHVIPIIRREGLSFVLEELRESGELSDTGRAVLASIVYEDTSAYDAKVEEYLTQRWTILRCGSSHASQNVDSKDVLVDTLGLGLRKVLQCQYGENPHQIAALYRLLDSRVSLVPSDPISPIPSYNNYVDASAALELCSELTRAYQLCGTGVSPVSECGTGISPVSECGTGVPPVRPNTRWSGVAGDQQTVRNLSHLQTTGRSYFVTFRTKNRSLPPNARDIILSACSFWHGKKMALHAAVVMPDHVHLLLTPFEMETGASIDLGEIIHGIKSYAAHEVNKQQGWSGPLWLDERWDRIMRNEKEFIETWEYIQTNPDRARLGSPYPWFWRSAAGFQEGGQCHRRDAGATLKGDLTHRPDATTSADPTHSTSALPVCTFIKHTNPCGVGVGTDRLEAYRHAYLGDPNAAMGGILACNFDIDGAFASVVMDTYSKWGKNAGASGFFVEVWIAPTFNDDAVKIIRTAKPWGQRVRLLSVGNMNQPPDSHAVEYKTITGGMLMQTRDLVGLNEDQCKVVTKRQPSESEISDLRLAWLIAKHTKSNAISICKNGMLIGNGAGQMSRVMSCRIATWLASENGHAEKLKGSVAASDAFFPFPDGPNILMDAGVTAIIQPGGSKRDEETIAACDARNVAMIFTGTRHFKH